MRYSTSTGPIQLSQAIQPVLLNGTSKFQSIRRVIIGNGSDTSCHAGFGERVVFRVYDGITNELITDPTINGSDDYYITTNVPIHGIIYTAAGADLTGATIETLNNTGAFVAVTPIIQPVETGFAYNVFFQIPSIGISATFAGQYTTRVNFGLGGTINIADLTMFHLIDYIEALPGNTSLVYSSLGEQPLMLADNLIVLVEEQSDENYVNVEYITKG